MMKNEVGGAEPFIHSGHTWRDGSLRVDIPIDALNHFVSNVDIYKSIYTNNNDDYYCIYIV
jgi:hypothetical protein